MVSKTLAEHIYSLELGLWMDTQTALSGRGPSHQRVISILRIGGEIALQRDDGRSSSTVQLIDYDYDS